METPDFFQNNFLSDNNNKTNNGAAASDHFFVEDLLDFSNDDAIIADADATLDSVTGNSTDSSTVSVVHSCNSSSLSGGDLNFVSDVASRNFTDDHLSGDLCVPYDDLAELEWLSNFVDESFSSEDMQKMQLISGVTEAPYNAVSESREFHLVQPNRNNPIFNSKVLVPAKARSKRTRGPPCNWTSRLLVLSPPTSSLEPDVMVPLPKPTTNTILVTGKKLTKSSPKRKDSGDGSGEGRKCLHCSTDKTPQWRTGPMGPKTLCNACGVRYKSGRLVPEYRPAASPTFVLTEHSNSHRKVLELRRQKEIVHVQHHKQQQFHQHHQNMMFNVTNCDDYLIHQHTGPDFRQQI